ncbi:hypothetical protein BDK51DRAFT_13818, partial [Blyttiomyces helicus]
AQRLQAAPKPQLARLLDTLDKEQLVAIIASLAEEHPELAPKIAEKLPRPTLASANSLLAQCEKRISEAFPYAKWGADRSDYSFNRVR